MMLVPCGPLWCSKIAELMQPPLARGGYNSVVDFTYKDKWDSQEAQGFLPDPEGLSEPD